MAKKKEKTLKETILEQYKDGNIVVSTFEGLVAMKLDEVIKQPIEGLLYDLNRDFGTILTFLNDPKWVNDYALSTVLCKLSEQSAEKDKQIEKLKELVKLKNEYRDFCKKEYDTVVMLAYVHGWRADKGDIKKGKEYRKRIAELEKQLK